MARSGFTDSQIDACSVRCGVGALAPLRETVRRMFSGTVEKFSGIMSGDVLRGCFEWAIVTIDRMLVGFMQGAPRWKEKAPDKSFPLRMIVA